LCCGWTQKLILASENLSKRLRQNDKMALSVPAQSGRIAPEMLSVGMIFVIAMCLPSGWQAIKLKQCAALFDKTYIS